jgi:nicotinate-nucleotide adenylyltransferase
LRTGIFGGSFNPVHGGHLITLEFSIDLLELDRVFVIPLKEPVHQKKHQPLEPHHRMEMLNIAFADNPRVTVSSIELERDSPSYTIETLEYLQVQYPDDDFILIIGADSYDEFHSWYRSEEIISRAQVAVLPRDGYGDRKGSHDNFLFPQVPLVTLSSWDIVERIRQGKSIRYMVPRDVEKYIEENRLYT